MGCLSLSLNLESSDELLGISCFGTSVHIGFLFLSEDHRLGFYFPSTGLVPLLR